MNAGKGAMPLIFSLFSAESLLAHTTQVKSGEIEVFGGKASVTAVLDHYEELQSLTLTIDMQSFMQAPVDAMKSFTIGMPEIVKYRSFFDHVTIDWNPHGHHPIPIYGKPHFDFHFYNP